MAWNLRLHGDFLEREFSQFIEENLPAYSLIWRTFIGNDGTAHMAKLFYDHKGKKRESVEETGLQRTNLSEYIYTCIESIILLNHIIKKDFKLKGNFDDFFDLQNNFLAFHANSGRIRDNIKAILTLYGKDKVDETKLNTTVSAWLQTLEDYYQQRNAVLHGKKLPFGEFDGNFLIIIPEGDVSNPMLWKSSKSWDDVSEADLEYCIDYLKETFRGIVVRVNGILFNVFKILEDVQRKKNLFLDDPPADPSDNSSSGRSGFKY